MNEMYTYTVPLFVKMLGGLKNVLAKGEVYVNEQGLNEVEFLKTQLAPDMFPLTRQVQIATDNAKGATARLTALDAPKYEDTETTFADLYARIDKTIEYVKSIPASAFEGASTRQITLPYFPGKFMTGEGYVREYVIPNFLFHVTAAYAILRMEGVPLGKADFLHGLPLQDL